MSALGIDPIVLTATKKPEKKAIARLKVIADNLTWRNTKQSIRNEYLGRNIPPIETMLIVIYI